MAPVHRGIDTVVDLRLIAVVLRQPNEVLGEPILRRLDVIEPADLLASDRKPLKNCIRNHTGRKSVARISAIAQ